MLFSTVAPLKFFLKRSDSAFTLIELSIVLVIIGLIVGGVLVGRDLISAAEARSVIGQIERYQTATNTFREKYGGLPGDLPSTPATQFGFAARGTGPGQGDGNGIVEGYSMGGGPEGYIEGEGETPMFWVDLSAVHLIEGSFSTASETVSLGSTITGTGINLWFPQSSLGTSNYIYVWSGIYFNGASYISDATNYFCIGHIQGLYSFGGVGLILSSPTTAVGVLTVKQAYDIDAKVDDGRPFTGTVKAMALHSIPIWGNDPSNPNTGLPYTTATAPSSSTCMDNGSTAGTNWVYSLSQNSGGKNCSLSFKFQ